MDSIRLAEIIEKHKNDFQWGDDTLHGAIESAVKEALQLALVVGDKMRFSTELLKDIHDQPDHHSELVVVQALVRSPDGCVTVRVARMEPHEPTATIPE
jgi:hypothetical protein